MSIKHDHTLNPITALEFYLAPAGRLLILAGEGCYLKVFEAESSKLICQCQIFEDQTIHGISVRDDVVEEGALQAVIWGGSSLTLLRKAQFERLLSEGAGSIVHLGRLTSDWILDAAISPYDNESCVLVTAHNTVVRARLLRDSQVPQLDTLHSPSRSILYSADIIWTSASCILVAAGTVFGEIIAWECSSSATGTSRVLATFTGHEGSIFGVDISPPVVGVNGNTTRLLASCSDDRTIRVWDIYGATDGKIDAELAPIPESQAPRETGFGDNKHDQKTIDTWVAMVMGHASRIWKVKFNFSKSQVAEPPIMEVLSLGEDSTAQLWALNLLPTSQGNLNLGQPATLAHLDTFSFHSGKHIWSTALKLLDGSSTLLATGGADGKISFYELSSRAVGPLSVSMTTDKMVGPYSHPSTLFTSGSMSMVDILRTLPESAVEVSAPVLEEVISSTTASPDTIPIDKKPPKNAKAKKAPTDSFNRYAFVSEKQLLLTSTFGRVFLLDVSQSLDPREVQMPNAGKEDLMSYSIVKGIPELGLALLGGVNGKLYLYMTTEAIKEVAHVSGKVADIFTLIAGDTTNVEFLVTVLGDCSATLFGLDLTPGNSGSTTTSIAFNLPEKFVVTGVGRDKRNLALGSRNGSLLVYDSHALDTPRASWSGDDTSAGDAITTVTFLPKLQHADITYLLTTGRNGIYSFFAYQTFESPDCIVSNLWKVHHGTPPLGPNIEAAWFEGKNLLLYGFRSKNFIVWNETTQCEIMNVECGGAHRSFAYMPLLSGGGHFVYTKASKLYVNTQVKPSHRIIKSGGHGRETKACAVSSDKSLIATGAEDTAIRIWSYGHEFESKAVVRKHSTGIQALQFYGAEYLFSSGGNEEFFVWALHSIPEFGIGVVCEARYPDQSPEKDLRIMSFDVSKLADDLLISLAFSDSTIRCYRYVKATKIGMMTKGRFELLARGRYTSSCLMQIRHLDNTSADVHLLTAATDGNLVVWKATFSSAGDEPAQLAKVSTHKFHQSTIKCLDFTFLEAPRSIVVATGGDDNALGITVYDALSFQRTPRSIILRSAHAAAITGLTLVPSTSNGEGEAEVRVVSSSNDQRVKEWVVKISGRDERPMEIRKAGDVFTSVADVGDVVVLRDTDEERKVLVVGNGMEVFDVSLNH